METYIAQLQDLYNRVPRRHSAENMVEINGIVHAYATVLGQIEATNDWYEKNTAVFYPSLENIQQQVKMANSSKHAKKAKDNLFDEASGALKDDIQSLIAVLNSAPNKA